MCSNKFYSKLQIREIRVLNLFFIEKLVKLEGDLYWFHDFLTENREKLKFAIFLFGTFCRKIRQIVLLI